MLLVLQPTVFIHYPLEIFLSATQGLLGAGDESGNKFK